MRVGQALRDARVQSGITQNELADELFVSRSLVAMVETGKRDLPNEVVPAAVTKLDCGFLMMEVAAAYTGGAFVTRLNGKNVDLHRASTRDWVEEEFTEAVESVATSKIANKPQALSQDERQSIEESIMQIMDALVAGMHHIVVLCNDYGFSHRAMWAKHYEKLRQKQYAE